MLIPSFTEDGQLPLGRHPCSLDEARRRLVDDMDDPRSTRRMLWVDWQDSLALVRTHLTVRWAWSGGSFASAEPEPADIDVVLFVDGQQYDALDPEARAEVMPFGMGKPGRVVHDLALDSFMVSYDAVLKPLGRGVDDRADAYYWHRGKWDDFWQLRRPASPATAGPPVVRPVRGYLEVVIGG